MFDSVEVELSGGYEFAFLLEHFKKKKKKGPGDEVAKSNSLGY